MKTREKYQTLPEIKVRVDELLAQFETFDCASEEFWVVYDELVVLLDHGTQVALREGVKDVVDEFRERMESLKDRVPSGYWK